nr:hypothetical protein [uncultured Flavobacterium sp.]
MKFFFKILLIGCLGFTVNTVSQETTGSFNTKITTDYSYGYLLHKPEDLKSKKPLIVFLHGSGERGTDLEKLKVHGPFKYIADNNFGTAMR